MNISLPADLLRFLSDEVASGRYKTADEVIEEALHLLFDRQRLIDDLNAKIDEAFDDVANGRTYSPEDARNAATTPQAESG